MKGWKDNFVKKVGGEVKARGARRAKPTPSPSLDRAHAPPRA